MAAFNSIKKILFALLICTGLVPVCSAVTATETAQQKRPSAWELLRKYAESISHVDGGGIVDKTRFAFGISSQLKSDSLVEIVTKPYQ